MSDAIQAEGLVKRFGETTALAGADLEARTGSVLAVLGPNGAGKTTAVRILATLLQPDAGRATVAGYDVVAQAHQVRQLIALTGQYAAVDESLTGTENLVLIGRLLGLSRAGSRRRAATLLEEFALADAAGRATKTYSGGMRRRLDLAASMVGRPRVLYLDEPTTGLDPRGRGDLWRVVRGLVGEGVTVLLTTQYMDEADQLADDVVVIDRGRVVATGTPDQLKTQVGGQVLHVSPVREADMATVVRVVTGRRRMGDDGGDRKAARRPTEVTMAEVLVLSEDEVASLLDVEELLDALADAFRDLSAGRASVPPRVAARAELGMLAAMPVALPGVALGAKLVSVFPDNHARGLPSHQGVIVLFGEQDGTPLAVMDGRHITAVRTGAATAVAARALARPDAEVLAILGAGVQGHSHLDALPRVRGFREIRVASRTPANAAALAALHPAARPVGSFEEAVTGADVVCCCTDAHQPVIRAAWLAPGAHVSSVGGIFGPELDADTVRAGRVFVEWRGAASNPPPAGAHELQGLDGDGVTELGEVLAGTLPGRTSDQEITVYKSTGHAIEDAAAARLVHERARQAGAGVTVTL